MFVLMIIAECAKCIMPKEIILITMIINIQPNLYVFAVINIEITEKKYSVCGRIEFNN